MANKNKDKRPYLTKRILVSAAKSGIRKAAKETMQVMGFVVIAENGWVIKKYPNGVIERIVPIQSSENAELALD